MLVYQIVYCMVYVILKYSFRFLLKKDVDVDVDVHSQRLKENF